MTTSVDQVNFQKSIGEQWAVTATSGSTDALSFHGSRGAAAKVASAVPAYCVRKLDVEVIETVDTVVATATHAQTDADFWSYPE